MLSGNPARDSALINSELFSGRRLRFEVVDKTFKDFHHLPSYGNTHNIDHGYSPLQGYGQTLNTFFMEYKDRLKLARKHAGLTQAALAVRVGIDQTSVSDLERGKSQGTAYNASIASECGVNPLWLETGKGEMLSGEGNVSAPVGVGIKEGLVPVVGKAQLGTDGFFEAMDYPVGHGDGYVQIFSEDPNAYALKVVGDSMQPRIRSGEYVLIEPNKPFISGDEVLVKTHCGRVMIKQLMYRRDGEVRLISVNDAHPPITLLETDIEKIHFMGAIIKGSRFVQF